MLYLGYLVARLFTTMLPRRLCHGVSGLVAELWYKVSPALRRTLDCNLAVLPGLGSEPAARRALARRVVRNFAIVVTDFLYLPRITRQNLSRYVAPEDLLEIKAMTAGRPTIFVTAHLGSWEMAAASAALVGIDLHVIVWDHPDRRVAEFYRKQREAKGLKLMSIRDAGRSLPSVLRTSSVGLAADRDLTGQGISARFFGVTTTVPSAYAGLACGMGLPVVPVFCVRLGDGRYHVFHEEPIVVERNAPGGAELVLDACLRAIEKYVEKHPDQWYRFDSLTG